MAEENEQQKMQRRRVTLNDGRYLIFYTFDEQLNSGREVEGEDVSRSEPDAEPQALEERRV
jgi:hypothetical protein